TRSDGEAPISTTRPESAILRTRSGEVAPACKSSKTMAYIMTGSTIPYSSERRVRAPVARTRQLAEKQAEQWAAFGPRHRQQRCTRCSCGTPRIFRIPARGTDERFPDRRKCRACPSAWVLYRFRDRYKSADSRMV